jgi:hypothetical protein
MPMWRRWLPVLAALVTVTGCASPFGREYEYEEQLYMSVDGSATVIVDSSIAALVALRGLPLEISTGTRFDPLAVRRLYESMGCKVSRVGQPWYRHGRRFMQVRLTTTDVTHLGDCKPLAWSTYRFDRVDGTIRYRQTVGAAAAPGAGTAGVRWDGSELVAFRLHVPSKVLFHNVRRLRDNSPGEPERGNILNWEQRLADRLTGAPVDIQVWMDPTSILYRTLWLFVGSFAAAVVVMAVLIAWTMRKGKQRRA